MVNGHDVDSGQPHQACSRRKGGGGAHTRLCNRPCIVSEHGDGHNTYMAVPGTGRGVSSPGCAAASRVPTTEEADVWDWAPLLAFRPRDTRRPMTGAAVSTAGQTTAGDGARGTVSALVATSINGSHNTPSCALYRTSTTCGASSKHTKGSMHAQKEQHPCCHIHSWQSQHPTIPLIPHIHHVRCQLPAQSKAHLSG
jgi:hypothetical protein